MSHVTCARGPSVEQMRPTRRVPGLGGRTGFPVYPGLVDQLVQPAVDPGTGEPDPVTAHLLAVLSGYAYSDAETVAEMMTRMGLESSHCLSVSFDNDPMFVVSTAFLVQSDDGRVVLLGYRGTEPANLVNWATDVEAAQVKVKVSASSTEPLEVHPGFYRNVRATRYVIVRALLRALHGQSVIEPPDGSEPERTGEMQALYITGHSLGGAMAALMGILTALDPGSADVRADSRAELRRLGDCLRAVYTYGQPMIGSPATAERCEADPAIGRRLFRFVYECDPVPSLPSRDTGKWAHYGQERQYLTTLFPQDGTSGGWTVSRRNVGQLRFVGQLVVAFSSFPLSQLLLLQRFPFLYRIDDHRPEHYIAMLAPPGRPTEFGDDPYEYPLPFSQRLRRVVEQWGRRATEVR